MNNLLKKISSIILLGGIIISCGEDEYLSEEHLKKLQAASVKIEKLNDFYETYEVYLGIIPNEAYLSTVLSRVDNSLKISLVLKSKEGQIVHNQDLRIKNGKSIIGIKAENYQSTAQLNKNSYGKVTIYNVLKRTLKDIISNTNEDYAYIDFLGFMYKVEIERLKDYVKAIEDVANEVNSLPQDLTIEDSKVALPVDLNI